MKRVVVLTVVAVLIITVVAAAFITNALLTPKIQEFYVGVTYCGNTTEEAKLLIDKVKGYTNLFVLQSGSIQQNITAINEIGDYAVDSGLNFMVYFGTDKALLLKNWLDTYDGRWNASFLGVYYGDEMGGKMLDSERQFYDNKRQRNIMKYADGRISSKMDANTEVDYNPDGSIVTLLTNQTITGQPGALESLSDTTYYPNGTVAYTTHTFPTGEKTIEYITDAPYTYEELRNARPFQSFNETAEIFVHEIDFVINRFGPRANFTYLTSDYGLYWFDYLGGYDTVLAQLGWNHSTTQDIALVRGAANLQNRSWGTIITWKYMQPPYLAGGQEIYDQMRTSYENGAKYVLIFNYAENMTGPYGTLKDEHFQALERFWRDVVQNPFESHGSVKAEAAFVLPKDFGSGLRNQQDIVWGLWHPTQENQTVWLRLQDALPNHGQKLDIVYDDPAHPVAGKYSQIIYWNQTG